jgi:electron transfer flavoprotein beta subunit
MPCLITTLAELNEPRYMSVEGIMDAYQKEIAVWTREDIEIDDAALGLKGSPTRVKKSYTKAVKAPGKKYDVDAAEAAQIILDNLKEKYII